MLWELYQQSKIRGAEDTAAKAEVKAKNVSYQIAELEDKIESLALMCQALWEIARDSGGLSDDQLLAKVSEIDLRDGVADDKMGSSSRPCSNCQRILSKRHQACMYCGHPFENPHVFDS